MEIRPSVVLVHSLAMRLEVGDDHTVGAFAHIVKTDLNCDVLAMDVLNKHNIAKLNDLHRRRLLMLVGTDEDPAERSKDNKGTEDIIHSAISYDVPIVVFPNDSWEGENLLEVKPNVYSASMNSPELHEYIRQLRDQNPGVRDEQIRRAGPEIEALINAYNVNYPEESLMYVPDDNTKLVAEYLRCRLMGGELVAKEYDATLITPLTSESIESDIYEAEIGRIRRMSSTRRRNFMRKVWTQQGLHEDLDGNWRAASSRGRFAQPFGINPDSMIYILHTGLGGHSIYFVERMVRGRVKAVDFVRRGESAYQAYDKDESIQVVAGFRTLNVDPYRTPILELLLDDVSGEVASKIGQHIISERIAIPVDEKGRVVDHSYKSQAKK